MNMEGEREDREDQDAARGHPSVPKYSKGGLVMYIADP